MRSFRSDLRASLLLAMILAVAPFAAAQRAVRFDPTRPLSPRRAPAIRPTSASDTLRLLGIMVQFASDTDTRTTGNGRFDTTTTHPAIVDPPPHDAGYFSAKFRFVENYFRRVSNGRQILQGDLIPNIIRLDNTMAHYAVQTSPQLSGLARLAIDAWVKADSASPGTAYASYDAFVLFHAGSGKDIDLVGILGFDPSPYDLPSVYLTLGAMRTALDSAAFNGIAVSGGAFHITNMMILPETESRVLGSSSGSDTLELSMNGLFAASVGSHLGLPDLFNTSNGRQGIGQFGLMDGAGIFAYQGICPPEPSAWEKVALGWVTPIDVPGPLDTLRLPAAGLTTTVDSIYRVRITDTEYYLIENRHRDPAGNGQRLTIYRNGATNIRVFPTDSINYFTYDAIDAVDGSVIDAEDPDWALLGRFGFEGRYDGGGILIWHIDEARIAAGLADNSIHADAERRGVDLEEADGSQDSGQSYAFLESGSGTESGSPLDAWFQGNEAPPYVNRFDDASFPNSRSNAGAASLVTVRDFSARSPRMTAIVERGTLRAAPLAGFPKQMSGELGVPTALDLDGDGLSEFVTTRVMRSGPDGRSGAAVGQAELLAWTSAGATLLNAGDSSGVVAQVAESLIGTPAFAPHPSGGARVVAAAAPGQLYVWRAQDVNADLRWDELSRSPLPADTIAWSSIIVDTLVVVHAPASIEIRSIAGSVVTGFTPGAQAMAWTGTAWRFVVGSGSTIYRLEVSTVGRSTDDYIPIGSAGGTVTSVVAGIIEGSVSAVVVQSEGRAGASRFTILNGSDLSIAATFDLDGGLISGEVVLPVVALFDVDRNGRKEIVAPTSAGRVIMSSIAGVRLDGSPRALTGRTTWSSVDLLAADLGSDAAADIIVIDDHGVMASSLPGMTAGIQVANAARARASVGPIPLTSGQGTSLFVTDDRGGVAAYDLKNVWNSASASWTSRHGGPSRTGYTAAVTASPVALASGALPPDRVYNWPNPVYGQETRVRFYTDVTGTATVTIFDVAGDRITTLNAPAFGGQDNEIVWNVAGIHSGVYLARVQVQGTGGSGEVVIKIAVVK